MGSVVLLLHFCTERKVHFWEGEKNAVLHRLLSWLGSMTNLKPIRLDNADVAKSDKNHRDSSMDPAYLHR